MTESRRPAENPRAQKIFVVVFIIFFVSCAIGVTIFGFRMVANVKSEAVVSDAAIRTIGWSLVTLAGEAGAFPTTGDSVEFFEAPFELPEVLQGADLPKNLDEAMAGLKPMPAAEALEILDITWPPDGSLAPVMATQGLPSGKTTLLDINGWMLRTSRALAAEPGISGG